MTTADVFARARMLGWTLLVLPLSVALLCGWAPHGCAAGPRRTGCGCAVSRA